MICDLMATLKVKTQTPKIHIKGEKKLTKKINKNQKISSKAQSDKKLLKKFLKEVQNLQSEVDGIAKKQSNKSAKGEKKGKKCTLKVNVNKKSSKNVIDKKLQDFLKSRDCYLNYKN